MKVVRGDDFLAVLLEAKNELEDLQTFYEMDESFDLGRTSKSYHCYDVIKATVIGLIGLLETDEIRGMSALEMFRDEVLGDSDVRDTFYELVESEKFPAVWELYEFEQTGGM